MPLRIVSWNVNGLRSCARKGFLDWLGKSRAQIVGLQEVQLKTGNTLRIAGHRRR